jgi:hypothetical protein
MRIQVSYVEGNADEINATRDTLKILGLHVQESHQPRPTNGTSDLEWGESKAKIFLKALEDEYPSTHRKVFVAMFKAGQISYEDLQHKTGMSSDQLKASLASLTKIARRDGSKRRPADWTEDGAYGVWEVDPRLRKVIEDHKLL